jgi:predicted amidophosphoribosyltransferase
MALPVAVRQKLAALMPGEHSKGLGRCPACASHRLRECSECGQPTMHNVATWSEYREEVCENGCTTLERSGFVLQFQAEMKEALYQFERAEARRKRRKH